MGSWGINPFECDEGLDIKESWEYWLEGENPISYEDMMKRFFKRWGDALRYGDSITNNEVIALVALHLEKKIIIPKKLALTAEDAINRELEESEIEKWSENKRNIRGEFLLHLLERIGGKRKKTKTPNVFLDPALEFRTLDSAKNGLLKSFKKIMNSKVRIGLSKAGFPSFILTLDRFMNYRIWEKDSNIYIQANNERLMMLATYLAVSLNYSEQELKSFLDIIEKRTSK